MADTLERLQRHLEGRYRIERELGRGGMATVFLATDLKHGRDVAIKTLDPEVAAAIGPERFLREIEIAARLHHPHVLALFDSGNAHGVLYYVMPYVAGESLRARLKREPQLPLEEAVRIAREVGDALSYAHDLGVVHRDIKPENILIQGGHALLADFGIARALSGAPGTALTATGMTLGTPAYMSPEQAAGAKDLDQRSDVYSLGCVLYEMLAGQPPFTGPTAQILVRQHLNSEPPDVTALRPGVPPRLAVAIRHALAKSPADRPRSAARFLDELSGEQTQMMAAAAIAAAGTAATTARAAPSAVPARRLWTALAMVALPALLAASSWMAWRAVHHKAAPPAPAHDRTEIAVLPFQNLSADPAHAYFAGGLQDELLTQLSKVSALKVISRTSVMGYAGSSKPLKAIAAELGVGSIVEGSVQVEGHRLRVTVQLIDAATDEHLWAEHYDRTLDDAFAIQSEVAQKIVAAVGAALSEAEHGRLATAPTSNAEAYRLYLQGLEYWQRPGMVRQNWETAQQLFERAVSLDSTFALAHAELSLVHGTTYWLHYGTLDEQAWHAARQREEAERAIRIAPDLPQAHVAMAIAHFFGALDYDAALRELQIAEQGLPNDAELWTWVSAVQRRSGHMDEAIAAFERASRLNPRDADTYYDFGARTYRLARRYADAVRADEMALQLAPDLTLAVLERGWTYVLWRGQLDSLRAALGHIPEDADLGPQGSVPAHRAELLLLARAADSLLQMPQVERGETFEGRAFYWPAAMYAGWAARLRGQPEQARTAFAKALPRLDSAATAVPNDWRVHAARGVALANLGRRDEARREAEWLARSVTYQRDAIDGPDLGVARAQVLAAAGDTGPALDELERRLSRPAFFSVEMLKLDPRWDAIRKEPRFQALIAQYGSR